MNYWLLKTEPDTFSIEDLESMPNLTTSWEGVRNYQARNMLRDDMQKNELAFFYHSSCKKPGIVGIVKIVRAGYPDTTALDPASPYFDEKSTSDHPRWYRVDVQLVEKFSSIITLEALRNNPALQNMKLLQKGSRLSVLPVSENEWKIIVKMTKGTATHYLEKT